MHNTGRSVHTDKAYASRQRRQMLQVLGLVDAMQRRAQPGQPLSECHKRRNQRIASKRARVEHAFAGIRHLGGKFVRTIGQARKCCQRPSIKHWQLSNFKHRAAPARYRPARPPSPGGGTQQCHHAQLQTRDTPTGLTHRGICLKRR